MTILTITGIRPDFIRMSQIFKKFDENFNHILVHTGQHYDTMLSDIFFEELNIRQPDYNLEIGGPGKEHFHQTSELSIKIIDLIRSKNLNPDLICFLGDSNSVVSSVSLKKEGYKIAHIEAGMRSYDKRMLEEINRTVCDHCSDYLFVYHENYKQKAKLENIPTESIFVVGNTIVEVGNIIKQSIVDDKKEAHIILDIHRPENFKYPERLKNIIMFSNHISTFYNKPIKMLEFGRTMEQINKCNLDLGDIQVIPLMSYKKYIREVYDSFCLISDSGTAQEEPSIFNTPVIVPRDFTERPESVDSNCSFMVDVNSSHTQSWIDSRHYINSVKSGELIMELGWLGNGTTSNLIVDTLKNLFK